MKKDEVTLGKLKDRYILAHSAVGLAEKTGDGNERTLRFLLESPYGIGSDLLAKDLEEETVLQYLIDRKKLGSRGRGLKHSSLNTEFLVIRKFLNWCHRSGFIDEKLLSTLKAPRPDYAVADPLTDDEIVKIFEVAKRSPQNTAIVALMLDTGLRRREVYELPLEGIDQKEMTVTVFGKGRKWRTIPYGRTTRRILDRHFRWRELVHPQCDRVFIDRTGNELSSDKMQYRLTQIREASGVTRLHLHLFRITYATRFLLNGGDSFLLKENLGHSTFSSVGGYLRIADLQDHKLSRRASVLDRANSNISRLKRLL